MATHFSIPTQKIPLAEKPGGYSPQGPKESDTTEHMHTQRTFITGCSMMPFKCTLFSLIGLCPRCCLGFLDSAVGKEPACSAGDPGRFLGQEDPLVKG